MVQSTARIDFIPFFSHNAFREWDMDNKTKDMAKRILMMVLGNVVLGLGAGMLRAADYGVDPYQSFVLGLDNLLKLGYGTTFVLVNGVFIVLMFFLARKMLNVGTLVNMFFLGYIIDFSHDTLVSVFPASSTLVRIVWFVISILLITLASAFIYTADLGVSTYDWIALKGAEVQKKVPFKWLRVGTDLVCVLVGLVFSVLPGVGTIITAFCLGPFVSFFRSTLSEPFLYGKAGEKA